MQMRETVREYQAADRLDSLTELVGNVYLAVGKEKRTKAAHRFDSRRKRK